jgi:hypothetical protein
MAGVFKQGDAVKLIQPVIQGTVLRREIIGDDDSYLVTWTDARRNAGKVLYRGTTRGRIICHFKLNTHS